MVDKEKIRPLYAELQGYLRQAPPVKIPHIDIIGDEAVWTQYNKAVDSLSKVSGEDYSRFLLEPILYNVGSPAIRLVTYRQKLGGLISRLHAEYFADELGPFGSASVSGVPHTVLSINQQQNQSVHLQMLLEIQSKIDENISEYPEGSKEKDFLQRFKSSLSSISNVTQLFSLFLKMAKEFGLSINDIAKFFS